VFVAVGPRALDEGKPAAKPGTKGVRAVAAGAVGLFATGRAAFKSQRFVREQLSSDTGGEQAEDRALIPP
jgi:hypothetical protein